MWMLGARLGSGRKLMWGWNSGLYARSGGLAEPRLPLSCGDCSLAAGMPASSTTTTTLVAVQDDDAAAKHMHGQSVLTALRLINSRPDCRE